MPTPMSMGLLGGGGGAVALLAAALLGGGRWWPSSPRTEPLPEACESEWKYKATKFAQCQSWNRWWWDKDVPGKLQGDTSKSARKFDPGSGAIGMDYSAECDVGDSGDSHVVKESTATYFCGKLNGKERLSCCNLCQELSPKDLDGSNQGVVKIECKGCEAKDLKVIANGLNVAGELNGAVFKAVIKVKFEATPVFTQNPQQQTRCNILNCKECPVEGRMKSSCCDQCLDSMCDAALKGVRWVCTGCTAPSMYVYMIFPIIAIAIVGFFVVRVRAGPPGVSWYSIQIWCPCRSAAVG